VLQTALKDKSTKAVITALANLTTLLNQRGSGGSGGPVPTGETADATKARNTQVRTNIVESMDTLIRFADLSLTSTVVSLAQTLANATSRPQELSPSTSETSVEIAATLASQDPAAIAQPEVQLSVALSLSNAMEARAGGEAAGTTRTGSNVDSSNNKKKTYRASAKVSRLVTGAIANLSIAQ
jgi:hypothetical protein